MMIDIYNSAVLPERPLLKAEVAEIYGITVDGLEKAVVRGDLPQPSDKLGPWGACRWHVGLIRAWEKMRLDQALRNQEKYIKSRINTKA